MREPVWNEAEELALAQAVAEEVERHGGVIKANFLLLVRPDVRKRLGDVRLLRFVRRFPSLFDVLPDERGGHRIRCRQAGAACNSGPAEQAQAAVGRAAAGALSAGSAQQAAHALRQVERELVRCLAVSQGAVDEPTAGGGARPCREASWLLRNGRVRRKLGALVSFLPVPELLCQERDSSRNSADVGEPRADGEQADAPKERHRCPHTAHARTLAGYLLQFVRDRPQLFSLRERSGADEAVPPPELSHGCLYGGAHCSCKYEVELLAAEADAPGTDAQEELLQLVAQSILSLVRASGSLRIPLARVGRLGAVSDALAGAPLLQAMEKDSDARAARGLAPRFFVDTRASVHMVSVRAEDWASSAKEVLPESPSPTLPAASKPRQRKQEYSGPVEVICEGSGVVVLSKPAGVTTEALLERLQALYDEAGQERRVVSVSRLDRDTSGVLVAATSLAGADCLTAQFRDHLVFKRYLALCTGRLEPQEGEVNARLFISGFAEKYRAYVSPKGKEARTRYEVLQHFGRAATMGAVAEVSEAVAPNPMDELARQLRAYRLRHAASAPPLEDAGAEGFSLVACYPITGRTHQIRAHLAWCGHPLVADANYCSRGQARSHFKWCPRLFLHCQSVRIRDLEGRELEPSVPLPSDLSAVLPRCA